MCERRQKFVFAAVRDLQRLFGALAFGDVSHEGAQADDVLPAVIDGPGAKAHGKHRAVLVDEFLLILSRVGMRENAMPDNRVFSGMPPARRDVMTGQLPQFIEPVTGHRLKSGIRVLNLAGLVPGDDAVAARFEQQPITLLAFTQRLIGFPANIFEFRPLSVSVPGDSKYGEQGRSLEYGEAEHVSRRVDGERP